MNNIIKRLNSGLSLRTATILSIVLGIYFIGSGLLGIISMLQLPLFRVLIDAPVFIFFGFIFFGFVIYCGILFIRREHLKRINFLRVCLVSQLLQVKVLGFWFAAVAGMYFAVGFDDTPNFKIILEKAILHAEAQLSYKPDNQIEVKLNLVALLLLILIDRFDFLFINKKKEMGNTGSAQE